MVTNKEFELRRDKSVAKAIAYSSTFIADKAENTEIWDVEGKRYIDFCGGIGCQNTGHRNHRVVEAIKNQLDTLTHTCFQVTPYESYIELAERLNNIYPGDFIYTNRSQFPAFVISKDETLYIQEYAAGVLAYLQFFYSPLTGELEFFGVDQRHESDIEGLGRIPAEQQMKSTKVPSFNVIGNSPLVLRESLLDEVYTMGENFVEAAKRVVSPGMNGPFCIEGVYDENAKFTSFEFSARIVAGTNIYMDGSPYYSLLFNENMSMGKRIAREVKTATESNQLDKITT